MKIAFGPAAVLLLVVFTPTYFAQPPSKDLAALEKKMVGEWLGLGGCDGRLVIKADGNYELKDFGPAASDTAGVWKIRWDALPPTLMLTCKRSELPEEVGQTLQVKLIRLDHKKLTIEYAHPNGSPSGHYARSRK